MPGSLILIEAVTRLAVMSHRPATLQSAIEAVTAQAQKQMLRRKIVEILSDPRPQSGSGRFEEM